MSWPPTGNEKLDAFLAILSGMEMPQVDEALARHNALEHELEAPNWNKKSALLLHRKIELQAEAFTRRRQQRAQAAPPGPKKTMPQSGKT